MIDLLESAGTFSPFTFIFPGASTAERRTAGTKFKRSAIGRQTQNIHQIFPDTVRTPHP